MEEEESRVTTESTLPIHPGSGSPSLGKMVHCEFDEDPAAWLPAGDDVTAGMSSVKANGGSNGTMAL